MCVCVVLDLSVIQRNWRRTFVQAHCGSQECFGSRPEVQQQTERLSSKFDPFQRELRARNDCYESINTRINSSSDFHFLIAIQQSFLLSYYTSTHERVPCAGDESTMKIGIDANDDRSEISKLHNSRKSHQAFRFDIKWINFFLSSRWMNLFTPHDSSFRCW